MSQWQYDGYQWSSSIAKPTRSQGFYELDAVTTLLTQVEALSKKSWYYVSQPNSAISYKGYRGGYVSQECNVIGASSKQIE